MLLITGSNEYYKLGDLPSLTLKLLLKKYNDEGDDGPGGDVGGAGSV